jgi:hypothetical protein
LRFQVERSVVTTELSPLHAFTLAGEKVAVAVTVGDAASVAVSVAISVTASVAVAVSTGSVVGVSVGSSGTNVSVGSIVGISVGSSGVGVSVTTSVGVAVSVGASSARIPEVPANIAETKAITTAIATSALNRVPCIFPLHHESHRYVFLMKLSNAP